LGERAFHGPQRDIQHAGEVYETRIKTVIQDLSRLDKGEGQDIWEIAVNWLTNKFTVINPEVVIRAMEDLRGIGLRVKPFIPKGQKNLLMTEYQPPKKEKNLSLGSIVVFEAPGL